MWSFTTRVLFSILLPWLRPAADVGMLLLTSDFYCINVSSINCEHRFLVEGTVRKSPFPMDIAAVELSEFNEFRGSTYRSNLASPRCEYSTYRPSLFLSSVSGRSRTLSKKVSSKTTLGRTARKSRIEERGLILLGICLEGLPQVRR
jgi:hypothetical protein